MASCQHQTVVTDCSSHAAEAGYERPTPDRRLAAATISGRLKKNRNKGEFPVADDIFNDDNFFPAPLVLPGDDLAEDPDYPHQSLRSWNSTRDARFPTPPAKSCIYVAPPPKPAGGNDGLIKDAAKPHFPAGYTVDGHPVQLPSPSLHDVCKYLRAFYPGMTVKPYEDQFCWIPWEEPARKAASKTHNSSIGLLIVSSGEAVRVRQRVSPDGVSSAQLNLNNITDALMSNIPSDAHALVMLTDHDLYEDDDDDFCCGRAYGGDGVAVVSSFRYNPALDGYAGIDHEHMWPASHCKAHVDYTCGTSFPYSPALDEYASIEHEHDWPASHFEAHADNFYGAAPTRAAKRDQTRYAAVRSSPIEAAVRAAAPYLKLPWPSAAGARTGLPIHDGGWSDLWFSRVGRTVAHELGHCFGLDHCTYFACVMQGTGSTVEDYRQPPYLCPVCLAKVAAGIGHLSAVIDIDDDDDDDDDDAASAPVRTRSSARPRRVAASVDMGVQAKTFASRHRAAVMQLCSMWPSVAMFAGWRAWLELWEEAEAEAARHAE